MTRVLRFRIPVLLLVLTAVLFFAGSAHSEEGLESMYQSGQIVAIDVVHDLLILKTETEEAVDFVINRSTLVYENEEKTQVDSIQAGDYVTIEYSEVDGSRLSQRVTVKEA